MIAANSFAGLLGHLNHGGFDGRLTVAFLAAALLGMTGGVRMGGALLLVGAWARLRGSRDLGAQRTPFPRPKNDGQLITTGIYARVRHPLYSSLMFAAVVWVLRLASWAAQARGGRAHAVAPGQGGS